MARRQQEDTLGEPVSDDRTAAAITGLAQCALDRLAARTVDAPASGACIESLCQLLITGNRIGAERVLHAVTRRRANYAAVADGVLTAAARRLGQMWQDDEVSFLEVSVGVSLIFRLNHDHAQRHVPVERNATQRQAVFTTLPGQAHNLGLVLAAEAFRQSDWQVTLLLDRSMGFILERVRRMRPDVVGLSVSTVDRRHQVEHLIRDLRTLPLRFRILLGGTAAEDVFEGLEDQRGIRVVQDIQSALELV